MSKQPSVKWRRLTAGTSLFGQSRAVATLLAAGILLSLSTFAIVCYLHFDDRVLAYQLIDDPAPFVGLPWYTGSLSYAGTLLWCASASACALAGVLLRDSAERHRRILGRLLLSLAGVNIWTALDDLLLIHEEVGEWLFGWESRHTGEALIFTAYALLLMTCFLRFRAIFGQTQLPLLAAAIVSLGASVAIDVGLTLDMGGNNIFLETVVSRSWGGPVADITEEILKLNGAFFWFVYLFRTGLFGVQAEINAPQAVNTVAQTTRPQSTRRRKLARR